MFVALVLMALGAVILNLRSRLAQVERRLALIEGDVPERLERMPARVVRRDVVEDIFPSEPIRPTSPFPNSVRAEPVEAPSFFEEKDSPSTSSGRTEGAEGNPIAEDTAPQKRGIGFEELFGRRLPIWAGGVTLAVAGVLLVKYSIDAGLLSPWVRVVLGLLFGGALISGAEVALRQEARIQDPRVRQSLAGAGLATLYAAILAAHSLYGLVGPATAFGGLAAITALAMALSIRFGAPSALLGLVGGLAAPALVSAGPPNVPLLSCYLALAIGGLCTLSRTQRWMWLGVGALLGGAGWGAAMLAFGALDAAASVSVALLLIGLGIAFPLLAFSDTRANSLRLIAAVVSAAQMAALVATGGFALLNWGLFGLLSAALVWQAGKTAALRPLGAVGLAITLFLAGAWPSPATTSFTLVIVGMAAIYGGPAIWRLWRTGGSEIEAGQIAAIALGGIATAMMHFHTDARDDLFAGLALVAAALPIAGMLIGWRKPERQDDTRLALLSTAAALLLSLAGGLAFPVWFLPLTTAAVAAGLLILSGRAADQRIEWSAWAFVAAALIVLLDGAGHELPRLFGEQAAGVVFQSAPRWAGLALAAALFAWRAGLAHGRTAAQVMAMLLGYGAAAQVVPAPWLPVIPALVLPALTEAGRRLHPASLLPALGTALVLSLGWALWPFGQWATGAMLSLTGRPLLASDLPPVMDALSRLALPAAMIGWISHARAPAKAGAQGVMAGAAAVLALTSAHILYKQLFHVSDTDAFVRLALAERTLWQVMLLAAATAAWRFARMPGVALGLTGAALAHAAIYTLLLHDPLWWPQHVGALPIVNLLLPAFAMPFVALHLAGRIAPELAERFRRPADMLRMTVILLFAYASLRQLFAGTLLTSMPVGQAEDILRSVLAAALAIGLLLWGMRKGLRDWRIASLLLILAAVAKVFLFDASGLDGLLRIASFLALGFSLIGIGWLYNRVLRIEAH